jgi:ribonuclease P protein component
MGPDSANRPRLRAPVRLKQGRDFARLREQGQRRACGCILANWQPLKPDSVSRLGVIASRRVGSAVVRNRARRLLREVFRRHQHELARPVDMVLVARASMVGKRFATVEKDFLTTLQRARLLRGSIG